MMDIAAIDAGDAIALYAALVATGVGLYQWRRDHQKLDLRFIAVGSPDAPTAVRLRFSNSGQTPVYVEKVLLGQYSWRGSKWQDLSEVETVAAEDTEVPTVLGPGQGARATFVTEDVKHWVDRFGPDMGVQTQTGKVFRRRVPQEYLQGESGAPAPSQPSE